MEGIEKNPEDLEVLVKQFLWINTSMGNWSYVLRALELKMKRAGEEKEDLNYEKMLREVNKDGLIFLFTVISKPEQSLTFSVFTT